MYFSVHDCKFTQVFLTSCIFIKSYTVEIGCGVWGVVKFLVFLQSREREWDSLKTHIPHVILQYANSDEIGVLQRTSILIGEILLRQVMSKNQESPHLKVLGVSR